MLALLVLSWVSERAAVELEKRRRFRRVYSSYCAARNNRDVSR